MLLKRKENKKSTITKQVNRKSQLIIVGSFLIIVGIGLFSGKYLYNYFLEKKEDSKIDDFYEIQEQITDAVVEDTTSDKENNEEIKTQVKNENFVAVIRINKIGLEKGLYNKESSYNNVNKNIQILKDSSYPDVENGNFIIAGHSGNGRTAYFKNLHQLQNGDEVNVFYKGLQYKYKVVNMYDIEKTGTANIIRNASISTLTMVTCRHNTNKQIIVVCELVEKI